MISGDTAIHDSHSIFKADLTHSQQLINFVAKIDGNRENVKKKEQVG